MPTSGYNFTNQEITVRFRAPYISESLNQQFRGIVSSGVYEGFNPQTSATPMHILLGTDPSGRSSALAVSDLNPTTSVGVHLTAAVDLDLSAYFSKTVAVCIDLHYAFPADTTGTINVYDLGTETVPATSCVLAKVVVPAAGLIPAANISCDNRSFPYLSRGRDATPTVSVVRNGAPYLTHDLVGVPDFWDASSLTGMTFIAANTVTAPSGFNLTFRARKNVAGTGDLTGTLSQKIGLPIPANRRLRLSVAFRPTVVPTNNNPILTAVITDAAGATLTTVTLQLVSLVVGVWKTFTTTVQLPALTTVAAVLKEVSVKCVAVKFTTVGVNAPVFDVADIDLQLEQNGPATDALPEISGESHHTKVRLLSDGFPGAQFSQLTFNGALTLLDTSVAPTAHTVTLVSDKLHFRPGAATRVDLENEDGQGFRVKSTANFLQLETLDAPLVTMPIVFQTSVRTLGSLSFERTGTIPGDSTAILQTTLSDLGGTVEVRSTLTSDHQLVLGREDDGATSPQGTLRATDRLLGANSPGGALNIRGGRSTGTGAGGNITFQTATASLVPGVAPNAAVTRLTISSSGTSIFSGGLTQSGGAFNLSGGANDSSITTTSGQLFIETLFAGANLTLATTGGGNVVVFASGAGGISINAAFSGNVTLASALGTLQVTSNTGDLTVSSLSGDVLVTTAGAGTSKLTTTGTGAVEVVSFSGPATFGSTSGAVAVGSLGGNVSLVAILGGVSLFVGGAAPVPAAGDMLIGNGLGSGGVSIFAGGTPPTPGTNDLLLGAAADVIITSAAATTITGPGVVTIGATSFAVVISPLNGPVSTIQLCNSVLAAGQRQEVVAQGGAFKAVRENTAIGVASAIEMVGAYITQGNASIPGGGLAWPVKKMLAGLYHFKIMQFYDRTGGNDGLVNLQLSVDAGTFEVNRGAFFAVSDNIIALTTPGVMSTLFGGSTVTAGDTVGAVIAEGTIEFSADCNLALESFWSAAGFTLGKRSFAQFIAIDLA